MRSVRDTNSDLRTVAKMAKCTKRTLLSIVCVVIAKGGSPQCLL